MTAQLAGKIAELEAALVARAAGERRDTVVVGAVRERLPRRRKSSTFAFRVADCEGYVTVGEYEDGRPGEVFMKVSKQGSTLAGIMDAFSISVSLGLQHGVPLATYVRKYTNMRFEPAGITDDADLRIATSLVDYIFRRLAVDYLPVDERAELGVLSTSERMQPTLPGVEETATQSHGVVEDSVGRPGAADGGGVERATASNPGRRPLAVIGCRTGRSPGPSSGTPPTATSAATPCNGPGRATCAGAAGRPAAVRRSTQTDCISRADPPVGIRVAALEMAQSVVACSCFSPSRSSTITGMTVAVAMATPRRPTSLVLARPATKSIVSLTSPARTHRCRSVVSPDRSAASVPSPRARSRTPMVRANRTSVPEDSSSTNRSTNMPGAPAKSTPTPTLIQPTAPEAVNRTRASLLGVNRSGPHHHPTVGHAHPFGAQQLGVLPLVARHQSAGAGHHPPPRKPGATSGQEGAHGTGCAGVARFEGHLPVGHDRPAGQALEHPAHVVFELLSSHLVPSSITPSDHGGGERDLCA